jgi:hypothetical protein
MSDRYTRLTFKVPAGVPESAVTQLLDRARQLRLVPALLERLTGLCMVEKSEDLLVMGKSPLNDECSDKDHKYDSDRVLLYVTSDEHGRLLANPNRFELPPQGEYLVVQIEAPAVSPLSQRLEHCRRSWARKQAAEQAAVT